MQNEKRNKKCSSQKQEILKAQVEKQQEEEENLWHVRENVVESYRDQEEGEEEDDTYVSYRDQEEGEEEDDTYVSYRDQEEGEEEDDTYVSYRDQEEGEEEENSWHVRENVVENHIQKEDENKNEDDRIQRHVRKSKYDKDEHEYESIDKYQRIKNNVDDEEQQNDEEYEEQPELANQQSRLASHFNFMRQVRNQYRDLRAPAKEKTEHSSHSGFIDQFWNRYRDFAAPAKKESEHSAHSSFRERLPSQYQEIIAAVSFLTILPFAKKATDVDTDSSSNASVPGSVETRFSASSMRIGGAYFPLVGLVVALITCLLVVIEAGLHLPSLVIAALVVVTQVWLTGGLHLDGLMDTCDGLFYSGSRERKLEIMHDSRSGAFGILGAICILLLKFALFASLDLRHLTVGLLIVLPFARWAMVLAMYAFPSALLTGLGAVARRSITLSHILIAAITSLLIALIVGQLVGLTIWVVGSLVALIVGIWMTYILNGLTGDTYGAIAEVIEVVGLLVLVGMR